MESVTDNGLYQASKIENSSIASEGEISSGNPPSMVIFPRQINDLPLLTLEMEESVEDMSPSNMWQVYALGAFMVAKWAWARWNERRGKSQEE